jgi:radical SAM superfamily enzyme YgiQ (UPF0313 family)
MSAVFIVNPPDAEPRRLHVTKDMAGGFGFDAGPRMVLPPLDLVYHALTLRQAGVDIRFFDLQAEDRTGALARALEEGDPPTILVQVTPASFDQDLHFIAKLKRIRGDARVLAHYGLRETQQLRQLLESGTVDRVLFGETELEIVEILAGNSRRGVAWLEGTALQMGENLRVQDLSELPLLDPDFLDLAPYGFAQTPIRRDERFFTIQSSRGCPFSCAYYCPYPMIQGKEWRAMSAARVAENLRHLHDRFSVRAVLFRDATFTLNQARVRELCARLVENGPSLRSWCETRINCVDEETLAGMARAGCVGISVGVETGDDDIMESQAKRGASIQRLKELRDSARRLGLRVHFLMMVGLPDETRRSLYESFNLIESLQPESLGVTAITPYPGTPLHEEATERGWIRDHRRTRYLGTRIVMRGRNLSTLEIRIGYFGLRVVAFLQRTKPPFFRLMRKLVGLGFRVWSKTAPKLESQKS